MGCTSCEGGEGGCGGGQCCGQCCRPGGVRPAAGPADADYWSHTQAASQHVPPGAVVAEK
jgi:hypothetical protein